jgi:hypothetical protein
MARFTMMFLFLIFTSSCAVERDELPVGVWKSENPDIIIYFTPEDPSRYGLGFYTKDGETEKIFITWHVKMPYLSIHEFSDLHKDDVVTGPAFIRGEWSVIEDIIYIKLEPGSQELLGQEQIIFHLIEDYEPMNLDDWLQFDEEPSYPQGERLVADQCNEWCLGCETLYINGEYIPRCDLRQKYTFFFYSDISRWTDEWDGTIVDNWWLPEDTSPATSQRGSSDSK